MFRFFNLNLSEETPSWCEETPLSPLFPEANLSIVITATPNKNEVMEFQTPITKPRKKRLDFYIYLDTLERVTEDDLKRAQTYNKIKYIDDRRVMLYHTFLHPSTLVIKSDTKTALNSAEKKMITYDNGNLFLDKIRIEIPPPKKRGRKRKSERDISSDITDAAKRLKTNDNAFTPINYATNLFFSQFVGSVSLPTNHQEKIPQFK